MILWKLIWVGQVGKIITKVLSLRASTSRKHIHHRGKETCALKATTPFYSVIQRCQVH